MTSSAAQLGRTSLTLMVCGAAVFLLAFAVLWGPEYLTGDSPTLFLYPLVFALLPVIAVLAILAIAYSTTSFRRHPEGGEKNWPAIIGMTGGIALLVLPLPVLWFGNLPLVVLGG